MSIWSKELPLTVRCLSPLPGFNESEKVFFIFVSLKKEQAFFVYFPACRAITAMPIAS